MTTCCPATTGNARRSPRYGPPRCAAPPTPAPRRLPPRRARARAERLRREGLRRRRQAEDRREGRREGRGDRPRLPGVRHEEHDARRRRGLGRQRRGRRAGRLLRRVEGHAAQARWRSSTAATGAHARGVGPHEPRRSARRCCSPRAATCPRRASPRWPSCRPLGSRPAGNAQVIRVGDVARAGRRAHHRHRGQGHLRPRARDRRVPGRRPRHHERPRRRRLRRRPGLRDARRRVGREVRRPRSSSRTATRSRPTRARRSPRISSRRSTSSARRRPSAAGSSATCASSAR